jgi:hypothetical protein
MEPVPEVQDIPTLKDNVFLVYADGKDAVPWRRMENGLDSGKLVYLYRDEESGKIEDVWYTPDDVEGALTPERFPQWAERAKTQGLVSQTAEWMDHLKNVIIAKLAVQLQGEGI